jgi:superfamily I DNA and/or RNA helicase
VTSWKRDIEVSRIADEVERLLKACDQEVSIGVITFYSAQRDAIFKALSGEKGITEWDAENGGWRVSPEVQHGGVERLRIGSVDAFQGKEFDIVLLSMVRSNDLRLPQPGTEAFETAANRKYGHLRLSNRMNVAMSRQRSLLVAVGDAAMARGTEAEIAVPALVAFLNLCGGQHGLVR